jgi:antitoxin (DNA-binding transcriptional repressor) of toxin-antitoxin stability system
MDYVTVRELREKSGEIWQRIEAGEEFVVTRNGKPFALLVHTEPSAVEDKLRALRMQAFGDVVRRIQHQAVESGASRLSDQDIQAEIDAVRREQRAAASVAAEPAPRGYARRR